MNSIVVPASIDEITTVNEFIIGELKKCNCPDSIQMQIELAVEEIFVNISSYAYHPEKGEAKITFDIDKNKPILTIIFFDNGKPFDPLKKPDVDTTLPIEDRDVGGLGILLVKKSMDDVIYSYKNGKNILTIKKRF